MSIIGCHFRLMPVLLALFLIICLTGCTASLKGYPDDPIDPNAEVESVADYLKESALKHYLSIASNPDGQRAYRNEILEARIMAYDVRYRQFQQQLYEESTGSGIFSDWAVLGLAGAGALSHGAAPVLAAAAGAVTGAHASFNKEAYFDKALPAILAAMDAQRATVLFRIKSGEKQSTADYPLMAGINDVRAYKAAGSIPGALIDVTAMAGSKLAKAEADLKSLKDIPEAKPVSPAVQTRKVAAARFFAKLRDNNPNGLNAIAKALGLQEDNPEDQYDTLVTKLDEATDNAPDEASANAILDALMSKIQTIPQFKSVKF